MDFYRKITINAGVLFIVATVTALISGVFLGNILESSEYLTEIAAHETDVILAVIFQLIMGISVVGIGFFLFPILSKHYSCLAIGYVSFRIIEAIILILGTMGLLTLLTLSKSYGTGTLDVSYYQPVGAALLAFYDWVWVIGPLIFLGLGGLVLYFILYQANLVPKWLSIWGLIGAALVILYGALGLFGTDVEVASAVSVLAAPIAVQEMVMAVWLIVKGFNPSAIES